MRESWLAGDAGKLSSLIDGDFDGRAAARDFLIGRRNRAWLPRIEQFLSEGRTMMITVGAAHLGSHGGVLEALCADGLTVERLGENGAPAHASCGPGPPA